MSHTYAGSGVNIDQTDAVKRNFAKSVDGGDARVLNRLGAFASLAEIRLERYRDPVLVYKTDEPGSKQVLAFAHDRVESLCRDLVNHLLNDVACMGAEPLYVQDCIVCGRLDAAIAERIVAGLAAACRDLGCALVGGETSVQPGVVADGVYVLSASAVGLVEREHIVDGARIEAGDAVLALAADGPHTNGYTLIRQLLKEDPDLAARPVDGTPFLDAVLRPHRSYLGALRGLFGDPALRGIAHITGGGIGGNLNRILPAGLDACIDLGRLRVPAVLAAIRDVGQVPEEDMLKTFNMGAGMLLVCPPGEVGRLVAHAEGAGYTAYPLGEIRGGSGKVLFEASVPW